MSALPFLTDAEIADICQPLIAPAAQIRYLQRLGLLVHRKPNGKPLIARSEFERVMVGRRPEPAHNEAAPGQPNRAALLHLLQGKKHGAQAQRR